MKRVLSFCLLLLLVFVILPVKTRAVVSDAHTIITNPGEDASSEMNINWHMDQSLTNGKLIYTKKTDTQWQQAKTIAGVCKANSVYDGMSSKDASGKDIVENPNIQRCTVNLTDLESDTEYMYKVGSTNMSEAHYFKTAGADEFSFVWISDFHAYTPLPKRLTSAMNMINTVIGLDPSVDFIFSTGDVTAWGGSHSFWKDLYKEQPFVNYMWAGVNGNHDNMDRTSTKNTNQFFANVNNNPLNGYEEQEGVCYYFKYGNALFIILNNEDMTTSAEVAKAKAWVSEVIENNPSQFIIVAEHYEWFNGVNGAYRDSGINRWTDVFDKYGVDLAMAGNNHIYLRSLPLKDKKVVDPMEGTVYIDAPSSDNERGQAMNATLSSNADKIAYRFSEGGQTVGAILVTVNREKITTKLINRNGEVLDQTNIPAKRMLGNLDKDAFKKSIVYAPSELNNKDGIIHCDAMGIGNVNKIEYLNPNKELLATNELNNNDAINFRLHNTSDLSYIIVKIYYADETTEEVKVKVTKASDGKITNFHIDKDYTLKWDYDGTSDYTQAIFVNNNYIGEVSVKAKTYKFTKINIGSVIELRDGDGFLYTKAQTTYTPFGDLNDDGKVDHNDIIIIQEHLTGKKPLSEALYYLADININGKIDMLDATYLQLYLNNHFTTLGQKKYKVEFKNRRGYTIATQEVIYGQSAIAPTSMNEEGYNFLKWNQDFAYITSDLVIYSLYEKVEGEDQ